MTPRARRLARTLAAVPLLALGGCASSGIGGGAMGGARVPLAREDRVVLTDFTQVTGVAAGRRLLFVASTNGLAVYDRQFQSWLPPLTVADGWPATRVTVMAADPVADGVWIGGFGEVLYWRPELDQLQRTLLPGQVDVVMFDARNYSGGAFVRSAGQWSRVTETGFASPAQPGELPPAEARVIPPGLPQIYQEFPALRSFEGILTRDEGSLRSWPVSAGSKSPDRSEVWLGTWGNGVFQVDPLFQRSEHRPFGLLDPAAGAIALAADGVWIAGGGNPSSDRAGLVFVSTGLREWRWLEHPFRTPLLGARAHDLETRGSRAWVATDRGVARVDTRSDRDIRFWSGTNGLPSDYAFAVAPREDGAWVGTGRGLVYVSDSARTSTGRASEVSEVIASGVAVRALLMTGDTLWIGSDAGLLLLPPVADPDSARPLRPAMADAEPRLRSQVTALGRSDSLVVIGTRDALLRLDLRSGRLLPRLLAPDVGQVGGIEKLAVDARTVWVAGPRGVLAITRGTDVGRFLPALGAFAGRVTDVVLTEEFAWIATEAGVVRLRRGIDGLPQ